MKCLCILMLKNYLQGGHYLMPDLCMFMQPFKQSLSDFILSSSEAWHLIILKSDITNDGCIRLINQGPDTPIEIYGLFYFTQSLHSGGRPLLAIRKNACLRDLHGALNQWSQTHRPLGQSWTEAVCDMNFNNFYCSIILVVSFSVIFCL